MSNDKSPGPAVQRVPGIVYTPLDGRAHVLDTGLEVFEIVRTWLAVGQDWERLTEAYHWLTFDQLRPALEFYRINPDVVNARLDEERRCRVEDAWVANPKSKPAYR
jgi:uncharacterized protein (DUF433 family)